MHINVPYKFSSDLSLETLNKFDSTSFRKYQYNDISNKK